MTREYLEEEHQFWLGILDLFEGGDIREDNPIIQRTDSAARLSVGFNVINGFVLECEQAIEADKQVADLQRAINHHKLVTARSNSQKRRLARARAERDATIDADIATVIDNMHKHLHDDNC
tara:strand:- start:167 stop:529 length:363 start_codon:yes stop_codon:yes gene_type:complete